MLPTSKQDEDRDEIFLKQLKEVHATDLGFYKLNTYNCMEPDGLLLNVPKELANFITDSTFCNH